MGDEKEVWADKAYDTHARRAPPPGDEVIKNRICRRGNKHHAPSPWSDKRNRAIARIRGRVDCLAVLKRHYGRGRARYLTLQRNQTDLILACLAINLRRALVLLA